MVISVREHWEGREASVDPRGVVRRTTVFLVTAEWPLTKDEAFAAVPGARVSFVTVTVTGEWS